MFLKTEHANNFGMLKKICKEMKVMNLKPLGDRVILKQDEAEETTAAGLYIASENKEKPCAGTVVAVGEGKLDNNGNKVEVSVSQLVESVISTGIGKMGGYRAGQREQRIKKIESNFKKSPVQMQELLKHAVKNTNLTTLIANENVSTVAEALERLYG